MKARTTLLFTSLVLAAALFSGCNDDEYEIRKPLFDNLVGTWTRITDYKKVDGKVEERPTPETETLEFRNNGTAHHIRTTPDGVSEMMIRDWHIDEEGCALIMSDVVTSIYRLTADEFGISYHYDNHPETGEPLNADYRCIYRRSDGSENAAVKRYVGKWVHSKSYEKQNGEWVEIDFAIPDEGWYEYKEDGSFKVYSRFGENVQEMLGYWRVNTATGEMSWRKEQEEGDRLTYTQILEDDNTLASYYDTNRDYATSEIREGEFKDIMVLEK